MCLAVFLRNRPRKVTGFRGTIHSVMSQDIGNTQDPQRIRVLCSMSWYVRLGRWESLTYENTTSQSTVAGTWANACTASLWAGSTFADEAVDAWQHDVLPDATVLWRPNIGVGATGDLSVQSGRTVISVSIRNGPDYGGAGDGQGTPPQLSAPSTGSLPPVK